MLVTQRSYTFLHFIGDLILTIITGGLWLIWKLFKFISVNS